LRGGGGGERGWQKIIPPLGAATVKELVKTMGPHLRLMLKNALDNRKTIFSINISRKQHVTFSLPDLV
jgi:hypothetical protein